MSALTPRLRRRIERDFPEQGSAPEVARLVADASDSERIQAAVVRYARQDWHRLTHALVLAQQDWRDVLVGTELADEDWRQVLDVELGHALLCLRERFGWSALRRAGIVVAFGACYLRLLRRGANRADLRRP